MKASSVAPTAAMELAKRAFTGKKVVVTGACGTVGRELVRQLSEYFEVSEIVALDHNETDLVFLEEGFRKRTSARFLLCDIRDRDSLVRSIRGANVVFHAAAYKHVYMCERSPIEPIQTNILGVQNILQAAIDNRVERVVFTSSDKAVNPTNVMGTSKLMGERLVTAAAVEAAVPGTVFLSTRFGNVLGSRGSVIPIFRDQIQSGGPVTLTDPEMTRFIMSLSEAVRLVIESAVLGRPGDVLITKMPVARISDLAAIMIEKLAPRYGFRSSDVEIKIIGPKPGEKMFEELMNDEETRRSLELPLYFVVRPAVVARAADDAAQYADALADRLDRPYNSANAAPLSRSELAHFMEVNGLFDVPTS